MRRTFPARGVLLLGLVALVLLAVLRPGAWAAVAGVPIALVLPGVVLQRRFLPAIDTDTTSVWFLRVAVSIAWWLLVVLGVGFASVPVASGWPVVIGAILLASVLVGDPDGGARWGRIGARGAGLGLLTVVAAVAVALLGRGLATVAGDTRDTAAPSVLVAFAQQTAPLDLAATGASGSVTVDVRNAGSDVRRVTVTGRVGAGLPWTPRSVDVAPGRTVRVTVSGPIQVCRDTQQVAIELTAAEGTGTAPLTTVVQGAAGAPACV